MGGDESRGVGTICSFVRKRIRIASFVSVPHDEAQPPTAAVRSDGASTQRKNFRLIRQATRLTGFAASVLKGARIRRVGDLPLALDRTYVKMEVEAAEDLAKLRMWEQGDDALYTRQALEERYANRTGFR